MTLEELQAINYHPDFPDFNVIFDKKVSETTLVFPEP